MKPAVPESAARNGHAPHRLIFSINSGRSGSEYLYRLLATAQHTTAFHEARPAMAGRRVTRFPCDHPGLRDRLIYPVIYRKKRQKVAAIRNTLDTLPSGQIYVETNHMFILSFYDAVMRHFNAVDAVLIRRYLPSVVKSFIDLNMFTSEKAGVTSCWTSSPNSPSAAAPALAPDEQLDQFERCIAYVVDIEARAQRFIRTYPQARVVETRLEHLNDSEHVQELFGRLDLVPTERTREVTGCAVNQKSDRKLPQGSVTTEQCLDRINQYLDKCREKGIELPDLPHLEKI